MSRIEISMEMSLSMMANVKVHIPFEPNEYFFCSYNFCMRDMIPLQISSKLKIPYMKKTQWTKIVTSKLIHCVSLLIKNHINSLSKEEFETILMSQSSTYSEDKIRLLTSEIEKLTGLWRNEMVFSMVTSKRKRAPTPQNLHNEQEEQQQEQEQEATHRRARIETSLPRPTNLPTWAMALMAVINADDNVPTAHLPKLSLGSVCTICMDTVVTPTTLHCNYSRSCSDVFHNQCIQQWAKQANRCPNCNHRFDALLEGPRL